MSQNEMADTAEFHADDDDFDSQPTESTPAQVRFGAISHPGRVRENNEDHFLIMRIQRSFDALLTNLPAGEIPEHFEQNGYAMIVADGMGGMAGGEIASSLAIRAGVNMLLNDNRWRFDASEEGSKRILAKMETYCRKLDQTLTEKARFDETLKGMGTTFTVVYSVGFNAFLVQIGDSRAYLHRGGNLMQLTRDQTVAQTLADTGIISQQQVQSHKLRHVLTNAIGGSGDQFYVDVQQLALQSEDRLLLCSDGLSDLVNDKTMASLLNQIADPQEACNALVELALQNGGGDNVTVLIGLYQTEK